MSDTKVSSLWKRFQKAFLAASRSLNEPDRFQIFTRSVDFRSREWRATAGESGAEVFEVTSELKKAGAMLVELATALSLVFDEKANVAEEVSALITKYDGSLWLHVTSPTENASVKLLTGPDAATAFAESRRFGDDDSEWARAARTRCIRKTTFGDSDIIEPGAVWFVEWLERNGAQTVFSCEGHPEGFHVVFHGSYDLAHALAAVEHLVVSVFRSELHQETGQWKIELDYWPETREERDAALRQLAASFVELAIGCPPLSATDVAAVK
jgi:hypothetical protein